MCFEFFWWCPPTGFIYIQRVKHIYYMIGCGNSLYFSTALDTDFSLGFIFLNKKVIRFAPITPWNLNKCLCQYIDTYRRFQIFKTSKLFIHTLYYTLYRIIFLFRIYILVSNILASVHFLNHSFRLCSLLNVTSLQFIY